MKLQRIQPVETTQLLQDVMDTAHEWETELLGEDTTKSPTKGPAEAAFEALRNGKIKVDNPQALIKRLDPKAFEEKQVALAEEIQQSMQGEDGYVYYVMPVPVMLHPGRGAQYRLLESSFVFKVADDQRPLGIFNIFPKPVWKPMLAFGGRLDLGLDAEMEWGAEVEKIEIELPKVDGELVGRVKTQNQLNGFLKVLPFVCNLGRMEIESQFSAATAIWRFDSAEAIRSQQHTHFILLLKVPKEARQITVEAAAQAEPFFGWLTAQIEDVRTRLPEAIREIMGKEKGLPLQDFQTWTLNLPE